MKLVGAFEWLPEASPPSLSKLSTTAATVPPASTPWLHLLAKPQQVYLDVMFFFVLFITIRIQLLSFCMSFVGDCSIKTGYIWCVSNEAQYVIAGCYS